jgi:asparagine synthase (glutamine-hydrolysing)
VSGIYGYLNLNGKAADSSVLAKMKNAVSHRGEALGFDDGRYTLCLDGIIYNAYEIKADLSAKGCKFISECDAEVLLRAYAEWGGDCLTRLNGMFAFAVYDKREREIFCARDRYGIKPFYYALFNNVFVFASEQKAIFEHPDFKHELDLDGLVEYFTFQTFLTDRTMERSVKTLPPGCSFLMHERNPSIVPRKWWDFHFIEEGDRGEAVYAEELDFLLRQAVKRQLVGDGEIGCFLSGGMDSGTVACIASESVPRLKTFTCGFDMTGVSDEEQFYEERRKAELMARAYQTEHYEAVLQHSDMRQAMPMVCRHVEEPRVGPTYTNYCISRLAGKFVKTAFSGTGGDELFAGYPWRYYRGMTAEKFDEFVDRYYLFWQRLIPSRLHDEVFQPVAGKYTADPRQIFANVFTAHKNPLKRPEDYINHALYFDAKTFLPGMLTVEDKLSMAHGLESRMPMLDNDLVDFAMRLPVKYKLSDLADSVNRSKNDPNIKKENYFIRTNLGKHLLRKTMEKYVPKTIDRADKQGFSAPDATWFRNECRGWVDSVVYNDKARLWEYLNPKSVRVLTDEHMEGKANRRLLIWGLMYVEEMLRVWF